MEEGQMSRRAALESRLLYRAAYVGACSSASQDTPPIGVQHEVPPPPAARRANGAGNIIAAVYFEGHRCAGRTRGGSVAMGSNRARGASERGVLFLPSNVAQRSAGDSTSPCLGNTYAGVNGLLDFIGRRDWTCTGCQLTAYEQEREKGESEIGRARHAANDQLKRVLYPRRSTRGAPSTGDGSQAMMHVDTSMYGNEELRLDGVINTCNGCASRKRAVWVTDSPTRRIG
ncbi:hypothetical protein EDB92DRAFT_1814364 [Lactarius akahatsu]|uniref:Uncharacterized protein n=1 Tax=Lactarius akahatsu TaxID=416441 RepID=A0AAD4QD90_9AGAM|nr:hypothetical protein EDB92DRAFT_1814364 [Lactarius akahatsu]